MQRSPSITFRNIKPTEKLEADILNRIDKLHRFCKSMTGARVVVELAARHHRNGNRVCVRIDLAVPGEEIVVKNDARSNGRASARSLGAERVRKQDEIDPSHRHAKVAVREAFESAKRQLQEFLRRRRGEVKTPAQSARARLAG